LLALASDYFLDILGAQVSRFGYTDDRNAAIERLIKMRPQTRPVFLQPYIAINENNLHRWQNP
jgi:hypothetical protein